MICRHCGLRIVWVEGQGWLVVDQISGMPKYQTAECPDRDEPSKGHRLAGGPD